MTVVEAGKEFLLDCECKGYTPTTCRYYTRSIATFAGVLATDLNVVNLEDVTQRTIKRLAQVLVKRGKKGSYINSILKVVRVFLQYCYDEGISTFDVYGVKFTWVKEDKPVITAFSTDMVRQLMRNCKGNDFLDVRDNAIVTMLLETGIRCSELCGIKPDDIHHDYILINGKGRKQRVVPVTAPLAKALLRYNRARDSYFAVKEKEGYYFLSQHGKRLTAGGLEDIIKRRGRGIEGVRLSPHTLRHTFAQTQLKMGTDTYTLSRLLGHENIRTTSVYLRSLGNDELVAMTQNNSVLKFLGK